MSSYTTQFYLEAIRYPCLKLNVGLGKLCLGKLSKMGNWSWSLWISANEIEVKHLDIIFYVRVVS